MEAIRADVEKGEVAEEAEFFRQPTGYVGMVEVNAGHGGGVVWVIWGRCTEDSGVITDVGAVPVGGEVVGVGGYGIFPCLEGYVCLCKSRVWDPWRIKRVFIMLEGGF